MNRYLPLLLASVLLFACGKDDNNSNTVADTGSDSANNVNNQNNENNRRDVGNDSSADSGSDAAIQPAAIGCDPIDPAACAFPWPSNLYLAEDDLRVTGYTLRFGNASLPQNGTGTAVDPAPYERLDGYSLGSPAMAYFPDLNVTNIPDETNIAASLDNDAQIVWLELDSNDAVVRRIPFHVDHDGQENDVAAKMVYVRPAVLLKEATRYVIAFRNLEDSNGSPIAKSEGFQKLLEGETANDPELFWRQSRFDEVFSILESDGISKSSLTLAWDFVTASGEGLRGHMLRMRDETLAALPNGPTLNITDVDEFTVQANPEIQFEMRGTIDVPHYMKEVPGKPGRFVFNTDDQGTPQQEGTRPVNFWVRVPRSAVNAVNVHGLVMYGHGLLGSGTQVRGSQNSAIANNHDLIFFAADLVGMSEEEGDTAPLEIVQDFSKFPWIGDRLHQGMLNWIMLMRAMKSQFGSHIEVTSRNISVDDTQTYYSGISQGGIFGPTFVALSPDVSRGHFGVPGINYSVLLQRSVDFLPFFSAMRANYPSKYDQAVVLVAAQLLWDGTDPQSYVRQLSAEPLPGSGPNEVIFAPAKGDYQVAVIQNELLARSDIGIALMANYDDERTPDLITETAYPHPGSGVVLWDFDDPWPAAGNRADVFDFSGGVCNGSADCDQPGGYRCCDGQCCRDPHGKPRRVDQHSQQMADFFRTGTINDVCGADGCHPDDYPTVP